MQRPQVDIVIPSYKPAFFKQALSSALAQTYDNCRIFVSDNCPDDQILSIVNSFESERICYFRQAKTGVDNYLCSFEMGEGALIKPLFDDDYLHPFCVERFVHSYLELKSGHKDFMAFSSSGVIDTKNAITHFREPFKKNLTLCGKEFRDLCIANMRNFVGEFSSVIFSRDLLNDLVFRFKNPFCWRGVDGRTGLPDVCFFLNASELANFIFLRETLSYFRRSADHLSDSNIDLRPESEVYRLFTNWFDLFIAWSVDHSNFAIERPMQMLAAVEKRFSSNSEVLEKCLFFLKFLRARSVSDVDYKIAGAVPNE